MNTLELVLRGLSHIAYYSTILAAVMCIIFKLQTERVENLHNDAKCESYAPLVSSMKSSSFKSVVIFWVSVVASLVMYLVYSKLFGTYVSY